MLRFLMLGALLLGTACQKKKVPKGERTRVFFSSSVPVECDSNASSYAVRLPELGTLANPEYENKGVNRWVSHVGKVTTRALLEIQPLIHAGIVYTVDMAGEVVARSELTGQEVWKKALLAKEPSYLLGGGSCAHGEQLFVALPEGEVVSLNTRSGSELWRINIGEAIRSAPSANDRFVFMVTVSNRLVCLDAKSGTKVWVDIAQPTINSVVGGPPPVLVGDDVIVGHTTGEVSVLRQENGHVHWRSVVRADSELIGLEDFLSWKAPFAYKSGVLYLVHPAGSIIAMSVRTGAVQWRVNAGYLNKVALGDNVLFAVDMIGRVICLERTQGKILWMTDLPTYEDPKAKVQVPLHWSGPTLAGNKLFLVSTNGELAVLDAISGKIISNEKISKTAFYMPPVVANKALYFITQNGDVFARE